jgi:hypothetical protein
MAVLDLYDAEVSEPVRVTDGSVTYQPEGAQHALST